MMTHAPLQVRMLPLLALSLMLVVGNGRCCGNAGAATNQTASPTDARSATQDAQTATKPAPPQLDIDTLIERLKQTSAIGVLTKLVLRSNVNDLIDEVKRYKRSKATQKQLDRIKAHFNGLLLKVLALLDEDPKLAQDIQCARDSLWHHLMEVKT